MEGALTTGAQACRSPSFAGALQSTGAMKPSAMGEGSGEATCCGVGGAACAVGTGGAEGAAQLVTTA